MRTDPTGRKTRFKPVRRVKREGTYVKQKPLAHYIRGQITPVDGGGGHGFDSRMGRLLRRTWVDPAVRRTGNGLVALR